MAARVSDAHRLKKGEGRPVSTSQTLDRSSSRRGGYAQSSSSVVIFPLESGRRDDGRAGIGKGIEVGETS